MTWPDSWPKRQVVCDLVALTGQTVQGASLEYQQTGAPWCVLNGVLVAPATISATFDANGHAETLLPRTDVAAPAGRTWTATVRVGERTFVKTFALPDGDGPLALASAADTVPLGGLHRVVATVNGVGPDEAGNVDVTVAAGSVAWTEVTGKPSAFPPSPHTHAPADVAGLPAALVDIDTRLDALEAAPAEHRHQIADIDGLAAALTTAQEQPDLSDVAVTLAYDPDTGWPQRPTTRPVVWLGGTNPGNVPPGLTTRDLWFADSGA
ncbi:hypothetical protein [Prauserella endophytica]|uniref:Uncharacterized protein n=1 Tax=Prauserella endophytica TaxID=1592324 RepID=A0ABY2RZW3_9PSEU|nr:hypothetical protein [Prauserella endophytica]PXY20317.1 hypothetical protein BAY59_31245 [Prauserella coralliicola]TKG66919.1 hypothetical protein FCN18_23690 [Prauserella endophytica]